MKNGLRVPAAPSVLRLTPAQALMSVAVMAAASDGRLGRREVEALRDMTREHALFASLESPEEFIAGRLEELRAYGETVLLADCRTALPPRLRETAFAWACRVAQGDGSHHPKENAFLDRLASAFSLPGPLAGKIRSVTAILRRAS